MKNSVFVKVILIAALVPVVAGCVERRVVYRDRPVYVQAPPPSSGPPVVTSSAPPPDVVVGAPVPPPLQVEVVPVQPDPTYVWVGGYWGWRGNNWYWYRGYWGHPPHAGAVWAGGHWGYHGHARVWVGAGWR